MAEKPNQQAGDKAADKNGEEKSIEVISSDGRDLNNEREVRFNFKGADGTKVESSVKLPKEVTADEHANTFIKIGEFVQRVHKDGVELGMKCTCCKKKCTCHEEGDGLPPRQPAPAPAPTPMPMPKKKSAFNWLHLVVVAAVAILLATLLCKSCMGKSVVEAAPVENEHQRTESVQDAQTTTPSSVSGESFGPDEDEVKVVQEVKQTTTVEKPLGNFGNYIVPDQELLLKVNNCLTLDKMNFRKYKGQKLDGMDKFDFMTAIVSTLIANPELEYWGYNMDKGKSQKMSIGLGSDGNIICKTITDIAHLGGTHASFNAPTMDKGSKEWWANVFVEEVPGSNATHFSNAVMQAVIDLNKAFKLKGFKPGKGLNDVERASYELPAVMAVSYTSTEKSTVGTSSKKSGATASKGVSFSPLNMATASYGSLGYISPIPSGYSYIDGGVFGTLRTKDDGTTYYHAAEDLSAAQGSRIVQPAPFVGTVISAKWEGGFGNCVRLDIGDAEIIFAHLQFFGPKVHPGAKISQGMEIGKVGSTGHSTGPHLHIEFVPKVPNFIVPIFIQEETAGAYSSGLSRLKNKTYKTKKS